MTTNQFVLSRSNSSPRLYVRLRQGIFTATCGLLCGLCLTAHVHAATVSVQVLAASNNQPIQGAAVCLGRSGSEYGAQRTDEKGMVSFTELPKTSLIVTVSLSQHKGVQRTLTTNDVDMIRTIHLPKGGLGPVCDAPPKLLSSNSVLPDDDGNSLRLGNVNIDKGHEVTTTRRVVLNPSVFGKPTHYRISEDPKFQDTHWKEFQKTPIYTLSEGNGLKKVYFQIRRAVEVGDGTIQTLSNVRSDLITLQSQ